MVSFVISKKANKRVVVIVIIDFTFNKLISACFICILLYNVDVNILA